MNTSMSISSIALDLSGAIQTANKDLQNVFQFVGHLMQAAEAFGSSVAGAAKKSAVLKQTKQFAEAIGHVWSKIEQSVSDFIDNVKAAWNMVANTVGL